MRRKISRLEQHPDGNEEDTRKIVPEGHDIGHNMVAVLGLRYDEPGEERAQSQGEAEAEGNPCGAEAEEHYKTEKYLSVPEPDHLVEQKRYDFPCCQKYNYQPNDCLAQTYHDGKRGN